MYPKVPKRKLPFFDFGLALNQAPPEPKRSTPSLAHAVFQPAFGTLFTQKIQRKRYQQLRLGFDEQCPAKFVDVSDMQLHVHRTIPQYKNVRERDSTSIPLRLADRTHKHHQIF